eukprot:COSAG03_NODE_5542_length_1224_cov_1.231111_4_plen_59_part_01
MTAMQRCRGHQRQARLQNVSVGGNESDISRWITCADACDNHVQPQVLVRHRLPPSREPG